MEVDKDLVGMNIGDTGEAVGMDEDGERRLGLWDRWWALRGLLTREVRGLGALMLEGVVRLVVLELVELYSLLSEQTPLHTDSVEILDYHAKIPVIEGETSL